MLKDPDELFLLCAEELPVCYYMLAEANEASWLKLHTSLHKQVWMSTSRVIC